MSRYAIYGNTRLNITDDSITSNEVRDSMAQIFPELRNATVLEKRDGLCIELHMVPLSKMKQHQLDIENSIRQTEKLDKKLQNAFELSKTALSITADTIKANSITTGWPDMGHPPGDADEKRERTFDARLATMLARYSVPSPYIHDILGKYASRGGYEHLVGKKARIISENTDLEIYTIQVEGDDTKYVIRMKDIQKR